MSRHVGILCLAVLASFAAACSPGAIGSAVRPDNLTAEAILDGHDASCTAAPRLVVDWPAERRVDLAAGMRAGLVVVRANCGGITVLRRCSTRADYSFVPSQITRTALHFEGGDKLRSNLPFDAVRMSLDSHAAIDVALAYVGRRSIDGGPIARDALEGECRDATHYVKTVWVGAFRVTSGALGEARSFAEVYGLGSAGVSSKSSKNLLHEDGVLDRCEAHASGSQAPSQCDAPIRIELLPIAARALELSTPTTSVARATRAGGEATTEWSTLFPSPSLPATILPPDRRVSNPTADADGIYFFEAHGKAGHRLVHVPSKGPIEELEATMEGGQLVTDASTIYWINETGLFSLAKHGGTASRKLANVPRSLANPSVFARMVIDDTHVYWTASDNALRRVSKGGGKPETLASGLSLPEVVAVDGDEVFWVELTAGIMSDAATTSVLRAMRKSSPRATRLVHAPIRTLLAIAADSDAFYWVGNTGGYGKGALHRVSKRGGRAEVLVPNVPTFYARALAVDSNFVYWLEYPTELNGPMRVRALSTRRGAPMTLATPSKQASQLFIDRGSLYWAREGIVSISLPRTDRAPSPTEGPSTTDG